MNTFFSQRRKGGKGEGAEGVPSLVKGDAVGHEARPLSVDIYIDYLAKTLNI